MIKWLIEKRKIGDLKGFEKNPRKFTKKGLADLKKSLENIADANIITINKDNTILGGHARIQVMQELGYDEVDVKVSDRLLNEKECEEVVIRLNANQAGDWDFDILENEFDIDLLNEWGLDIEKSEDEDNLYTSKITSPVYEITEETKPDISSLYDVEKYNKIVENINNANIDDDDKEFLIKAASRHIVFNYKNIAEYYAHSSKEVQELMEDSALVIIDYNKAIENGYVKLCNDILDIRVDDEE